MEQGRTNWNDDRLDHLSEQVDSLRSHMDERFEKQNARFDARFDALQNSMFITLAGILAAFGSALLAIRL
ncbi:MAG TPA: hypothetical protein VEW07_11585 [Solirubrobacterales bacterium]|nr:hypothetical protein [Solirubrobacterales bacterium]